MPKPLPLTKPEILWKDRKRYFGLPISFTRYEVTEDRLFIRRGLLRTETDEILIYRIMDIRLVRTLGQKLFGVGTVTLLSSDRSSPQTELKNIAQSDRVRELLSRLIERERAQRGITSREFLVGDADGETEDL